jgi:hypothetical protein
MLHTGITILNLEKALTRSENIRRDLVEVNRILTVAVQGVINKIRTDVEKDYDLQRAGVIEYADFLQKAENEVKKISIVEY